MDTSTVISWKVLFQEKYPKYHENYDFQKKKKDQIVHGKSVAFYLSEQSFKKVLKLKIWHKFTSFTMECGITQIQREDQPRT